jgi:hypothetical protein
MNVAESGPVVALSVSATLPGALFTRKKSYSYSLCSIRTPITKEKAMTPLS